METLKDMKNYVYEVHAFRSGCILESKDFEAARSMRDVFAAVYPFILVYNETEEALSCVLTSDDDMETWQVMLERRIWI
jgi:hypothetical protein